MSHIYITYKRIVTLTNLILWLKLSTVMKASDCNVKVLGSTYLVWCQCERTYDWGFM
jgi:hypothetical protein